jgi:hypothetical protein
MQFNIEIKGKILPYVAKGWGQTWQLTPTITAELLNGILTISGSGKIPNFYNERTPPWLLIKDFIEKLILTEGITQIGGFTCAECLNLKSVTFPHSLERIGQGAFKYCSSLTSITLPPSIKKVESFAFSSCKNLVSFHIPASLTQIGVSSLIACPSLAEINVDPDNPKFCSEGGVWFNKAKTQMIQYAGYAAEYAVLPSIKRIRSLDFAGSRHLTTLYIPPELKTIETCAFSYNLPLTSIVVSPDNPYFSSEDGVLFNKDKTELLRYPIAKAGAYVIPQSVTDIAGSAFYGCQSLTSVVIPYSVTKIGHSAFYLCKNLTSIHIPSSVETIDPCVFHSCHSLTRIHIPSSVTSLGVCSFASCTSLKDVYVTWEKPLEIPDMPNYNNELFIQCPPDRILHVYPGTKSLYEKARVWQNFSKIIELR